MGLSVIRWMLDSPEMTDSMLRRSSQVWKFGEDHGGCTDYSQSVKKYWQNPCFSTHTHKVFLVFKFFFFFSAGAAWISIPCTGCGYFIEQIYQHFKNIYIRCWTVAFCQRTYFIWPHHSYILSRPLSSANNCTSFYFLAASYHTPSADILAWT